MGFYYRWEVPVFDMTPHYDIWYTHPHDDIDVNIIPVATEGGCKKNEVRKELHKARCKAVDHHTGEKASYRYTIPEPDIMRTWYGKDKCKPGKYTL